MNGMQLPCFFLLDIQMSNYAFKLQYQSKVASNNNNYEFCHLCQYKYDPRNAFAIHHVNQILTGTDILQTVLLPRKQTNKQKKIKALHHK